MSVYLNFNSFWSTSENCSFTGTLFTNGDKKHPENIFKDTSEASELVTLLKKINGFWGAVVTDGQSSGWIAADRIRSYPVFYAQKGQDIFISNDAYWVREQCGLTEMDKDAEQEFLMTGYVTGPDTLFIGLKQIQQGELVSFEWSDKEKRYIFTSTRYYRYLHKEPVKLKHEELLQKLDETMVSAFKRLIAVAGDRTIAIPLSGGYDSRLVALMLKRLGYENLIAYTYGVKGNQEAEISREVAKQLQIPWHFVEYTNRKWYEAYHSKEYRSYEKFSSGLASLPHFQDWIAIHELKMNGVIPDKAIFVPGLIANVGANSTNVPLAYDHMTSLTKAVELSMTFHYHPAGKKALTNSYQQKFTERVLSRMDDLNQYNCAASLFENFNFTERQAKYINNSIRGYEFWGYDHWTVFWDFELLDFWAKAPWDEIRSKKLYVEYLMQESKRAHLFSNKEQLRDTQNFTLKNFLGRIIRKICSGYTYTYIRSRTSAFVKKDYNSDPMAWYGCWAPKELEAHLKIGCDDIIKMLSYDYIQTIKIFSHEK